MLKLLADAMLFILKAPFMVLNWINQFVIQRSITSKVGEVAGKELKPLSKVGKFFRVLGVILLWLILVAIFVAILWCLWWLNAALGLERLLGGPWPVLRPYWLPLLFVLFCVACIVGYR